MAFGKVSLTLKKQNLNSKQNWDEKNGITGTEIEETIKNCRAL